MDIHRVFIRRNESMKTFAFWIHEGLLFINNMLLATSNNINSILIGGFFSVSLIIFLVGMLIIEKIESKGEIKEEN
jgi:hypothetical protein